MGLYLTGSSSEGGIITSAASTIGSGSPAGSGAEVLTGERTGPELESLASEGGAVEGEEEDEPSDRLGVVPPSTTTTTTTTTAPPDTVEPPSAVPPVITEAQPALYLNATLAESPIASVSKIDRFLITSASAVVGHSTLSLWVDGIWTEADIVHRDLLSDVAIVVPSVPVTDLDIPTVDVGASVNPGATVYLGYCEIGPGPEKTEVQAPGCGVGVVKSDSPAVAEGPTEAENAPIEPDAGGGGLKPDALPDDGTDDPPTEDPNAEPSGEQGMRAGKVYSLSQTLRTQSNHLIYDPIRTQIPQPDGAAGAPLRDADGRIIGLVVGSSSPSVSALPVDRALAIAESFDATGRPSSNWIGIDGRFSEDGMVVTTVDPDSPAAGIVAVGDVIERIAGQELTEPDQLAHIVRQREIGAELPVTVDDGSGNGSTRLTIVVGVRND